MPPPDDKPILEVRNLSSGYTREPVITGIRLELRSGEMVGVLGPNDSGKTTLLRSLVTEIASLAGDIIWDGKLLDTFTQTELARLVAVVPQAERPSFPFLVREVVEMGRYCRARPFSPLSREDHAAVIEAIDSADLAGLASRPVNHLSGGEWQRVLLARALAQHAPVLLLDEPTTHLDLKHQSAFMDLVSSKVARRQLACLCISHDINLANTFCHRIYLLKGGRIAGHGTPRDLIRRNVFDAVYDIPLKRIDYSDTASPLLIPENGRKADPDAP